MTPTIIYCIGPDTMIGPDDLIAPIGLQCQAGRTEQGGPGGGGDWVVWGKPDYPGNRPGAWKRPTRRQT